MRLNDKFVWKPGEIQIIPPTQQVDLLARISKITSIDQLQMILPEIEDWMSKNPNDISVATALIEVVDEL